MYNVKTLVGDLEVIKNGTVHVFENKKLKIQIDVLEMEFEFFIDNNNKAVRYESAVVGNKFIWKLANFDNALGQGVLTPLEIGTLNNKKLFASFFVWTPDIDNGLRIINYVLYLKN